MGLEFQLRVGDATKSPYNIRAHLVYADPPRNIGKNEGAVSDKLEPSQYQDFTQAWIRDAVNRMRDDSRLVICTNFRNRLMIEETCRRHWLEYEQEIIWSYNFGLYTRSRFVPSHDNIIVYKLGNPPFNWQSVAVPSQRLQAGDSRGDLRGRVPSSVWNIPRLPGNSLERTHIKGKGISCQPEQLCSRILLAFTNKRHVVYDPFAGTGSMAIVCRRHERSYYGLDICEHYVENAKNRIEKQGLTWFMRNG